ncbi:MAG: hypothetical protein K2Y30_02035 [Flavobacteriaceae bacterium]|nr:hypothetical protein [Flavobacteriaceae bacterium]
MLPINRIREYQAEVKATLLDADGKPLFNYINMIIDKPNLADLLKERVEEENSYLIAVLPEFRFKGSEDNVKAVNILSFFILNKTDYSEHDQDGFINIFVETQFKAIAFVKRMLEDKANFTGALCHFLNLLDEASISVNPVWNMDGCNGWVIDINLDTVF